MFTSHTGKVHSSIFEILNELSMCSQCQCHAREFECLSKSILSMSQRVMRTQEMTYAPLRTAYTPAHWQYRDSCVALSVPTMVRYLRTVSTWWEPPSEYQTTESRKRKCILDSR